MYFNKAVCHITLSVGASLLFSSLSVAQPVQSSPETVLATFRVKPDQLSAFLKLMPEYWEALRAQDLVLADPHLVLQGPRSTRTHSCADSDVLGQDKWDGGGSRWPSRR
jgi:hypothetical protein